LIAYWGTRMDTISRTQKEVKLVHRVFILAWFCLLFMVHTMSVPLRHVSAWLFVALCILAAYAIFVGFAMRKRYLKRAREALSHDSPKASQFWKSANVISFCSATNPTIYGVVLKIFGSSWLVPGILFGLGLGFLLLWRPRHLSVNDVQLA